MKDTAKKIKEPKTTKNGFLKVSRKFAKNYLNYTVILQ